MNLYMQTHKHSLLNRRRGVLQHPATNRGNEENQTLLPTSLDVDNANGTRSNMSGSFAIGTKLLTNSLPVSESLETCSGYMEPF